MINEKQKISLERNIDPCIEIDCFELGYLVAETLTKARHDPRHYAQACGIPEYDKIVKMYQDINFNLSDEIGLRIIKELISTIVGIGNNYNYGCSDLAEFLTQIVTVNHKKYGCRIIQGEDENEKSNN